MTKMALDEQQSRYYPNVKGVSRKEFVGNRQLLGFCLGTVIYGILFILVAALLYLSFREIISLSILIVVCVVGLILYIVMLYVILRTIKKHATKRYNELRKRIDAIRQNMESLEAMYQNEEIGASHEG